jgi:hypothetical protein
MKAKHAPTSQKTAVFGNSIRMNYLRESKRFFVWKCIYHSSVFYLLLVSCCSIIDQIIEHKRGQAPTAFSPCAASIETNFRRDNPRLAEKSCLYAVILYSHDCGYTKGVWQTLCHRGRGGRQEDGCVCGALISIIS